MVRWYGETSISYPSIRPTIQRVLHGMTITENTYVLIFSTIHGICM
jgi:hypothetical protein